VDMPLNTTDELLKRFYENIKLSFEVTLSAREMEAIFHLCQGKSAKEIGKLLNLSHRTVETHIYNIREKMGCPNKLTLISLFRPLIPG